MELDRQFGLFGRAVFRDYWEAYNQAVLFARSREREIGIEKANEFGKTVFRVKGLPKPENRFGHELRMEVVRPTDPLTIVNSSPSPSES